MPFAERRTEGHLAVITLNRPEALNALSGEVADELAKAFRDVATDSAVRAMVLAADGDRAFCVGADLKERNRLDDAGWLANRLQMRGMFDALRAVPQPTIASVFGFALGGGFELALSCDLIVAAEESVFGLPETGAGLVPGGGATQLLARALGPARAKELIFTGRRVQAEELRIAGLVARVVPRGTLEESTRALANQIAASSPVAVREAKRAIDRGLGLPLEYGLDVEDLAWRRTTAHRDRAEGIAAFNEKRAPEWTGP